MQNFHYIYLGLLASVVGLGVSIYIYRKKRQQSKLFCPLRTKCDEVVNSVHAKTLGIPNEVLGLLYYIFTGIYFSMLLLIPHVITSQMQLVVTVIVSLGLLFSFYLISLQAFVLKAWCTWCLLSAVSNVLLVVSLVGFL